MATLNCTQPNVWGNEIPMKKSITFIASIHYVTKTFYITLKRIMIFKVNVFKNYTFLREILCQIQLEIQLTKFVQNELDLAIYQTLLNV